MRRQTRRTNRASIEVVEAVAAAAGVQPDELDRPLADVIDPDALDQLFDPSLEGAGRAGTTVTFDYAGYTVTVRSGESVVVE